MRVLPDFRLILLALAVMPMTLHQAASWSADALTLGITFLLIAYILRLSFSPEVKRVGWREVSLLSALVVVSSLMKFNIWLVLAAAMIPALKLAWPWTRQRFVGFLVFLGGLSALVWQISNRYNNTIYLQYKKSLGIDLDANVAFSSAHPTLVLSDTLSSLMINGQRLATMFVGYFGFLSVPLPLAMVWAYVILLALLALTQTYKVELKRWHRFLLAFIVIASVLSTFALIFDFETAATYIHSSQPPVQPIGAVQGRYFIPFALLFLLVFSSRKLRLSPRTALILTLLVAFSANATAYYLVYEDYYAGASMKTLQVHGVRWPDGQVFLSVNGKLHKVPDRQTFDVLNLHDPLQAGDPAKQSALVETPLPALPGRVLKDASLPGIYFIDNGARHGIPNPATQIALGLKQVSVVPDAVLESIPEGLPLQPIDAPAAAQQ